MASREPQGGNFLNQTPARARSTSDEHAEPGHIIEEEELVPADPWRHRHAGMRCKTCMFFVAKVTLEAPGRELVSTLGRCRRHAPTLSGYPAVFVTDWCGDHKLDENK
jgi:hypothetical protein